MLLLSAGCCKVQGHHGGAGQAALDPPCGSGGLPLASDQGLSVAAAGSGMSPPACPRPLVVLVSASFIAGLLHVSHNAGYIAFYPGMPNGLMREKFRAAWLGCRPVGAGVPGCRRCAWAGRAARLHACTLPGVRRHGQCQYLVGARGQPAASAVLSCPSGSATRAVASAQWPTMRAGRLAAPAPAMRFHPRCIST